MQQGFFYDFSNYGTHDRLTDDGLTKWHPAFLSLGKSLEECAARYRGFCKNINPSRSQREVIAGEVSYCQRL
jgi:putative transposase